MTAEPTLPGRAPDGSDRFLLRLAEAAHAEAHRGGTRRAIHEPALRHAGRTWPAFEAGLFAYALGLANWQARTRFCSNCAAPLMLEAAGHRGKVRIHNAAWSTSRAPIRRSS